MTKIYCIKCLKHIKCINPKTSYFWKKVLLISICDKCGSNNNKIFTKEEFTKILQMLYIQTSYIYIYI